MRYECILSHICTLHLQQPASQLLSKLNSRTNRNLCHWEMDFSRIFWQEKTTIGTAWRILFIFTLPKTVSQIVFRCSPSTFNDAKTENPNVLKMIFSMVGRVTYTAEMSNEISFRTRTNKPNAANNLTFFMSFLGAIQSWFSRTALFKMEIERPAENKCRLLQLETIEFDSDLGHRIIPLLISFKVSLARSNRLKCAAFDASTLYI